MQPSKPRFDHFFQRCSCPRARDPASLEWARQNREGAALEKGLTSLEQRSVVRSDLAAPGQWRLDPFHRFDHFENHRDVRITPSLIQCGLEAAHCGIE